MRRLHRDQKTVIHHIQVLVSEKLVTVTKGRRGTANTYRLHLSPMKEWMSSNEADKLKRQLRAAAKLKWKHKDKAFKADLENIYIVDGCVKGAVKGETNRERRLRQYPLVTVQEIPVERKPAERKPAGLTGDHTSFLESTGEFPICSPGSVRGVCLCRQSGVVPSVTIKAFIRTWLSRAIARPTRCAHTAQRLIFQIGSATGRVSASHIVRGYCCCIAVESCVCPDTQRVIVLSTFRAALPTNRMNSSHYFVKARTEKK